MKELFTADKLKYINYITKTFILPCGEAVVQTSLQICSLSVTHSDNVYSVRGFKYYTHTKAFTTKIARHILSTPSEIPNLTQQQYTGTHAAE